MHRLHSAQAAKCAGCQVAREGPRSHGVALCGERLRQEVLVLMPALGPLTVPHMGERVRVARDGPRSAP